MSNVLITGCSSGFGELAALTFADHGHRVYATMRTPGKSAALNARADIHQFELDVTDSTSVNAAVEHVLVDAGSIDIVVNNAGIGTFVNIADMTPEQWAGVIDTNVTGVFNVCHAALPELKKRGGGYIVNISSLAGKNAFVGAGAYCASKAALNQFAEVLNQEVRHDNIKVTTIAPGSVATAFAGGDEAKGSEWKIASADIGDMVVDLLELDTRSLPSYIELRPSKPPKK